MHKLPPNFLGHVQQHRGLYSHISAPVQSPGGDRPACSAVPSSLAGGALLVLLLSSGDQGLVWAGAAPGTGQASPCPRATELRAGPRRGARDGAQA